eukprot:TRINITY_DN10969_c0_g1_i1.p1 TRINITY_DN10969_c0_g1~~TRINITY_DN10969_c0_g1_i1.p1  ORF type:complete len:293 (-),score=62.69 TRINITY_DN10969_c0_g1_i1:63-941(-)
MSNRTPVLPFSLPNNRHQRKASKHERTQRRRTARSLKKSNTSLIEQIPTGPFDCGICLDDIELMGSIECCKHPFCFDCITEWSKIANTCPLCKARFLRISKIKLNSKEKEVAPIENIPVAEKNADFSGDDFYFDRRDLDLITFRESMFDSHPFLRIILHLSGDAGFDFIEWDGDERPGEDEVDLEDIFEGESQTDAIRDEFEQDEGQDVPPGDPFEENQDPFESDGDPFETDVGSLSSSSEGLMAAAEIARSARRKRARRGRHVRRADRSRAFGRKRHPMRARRHPRFGSNT